MSENTTAAPETSEALSRDPDVVLDVLGWVEDAPKPTAMTSKGFGDRKPEAKFQRSAKVKNPTNGKEAVVPVVGTLRQWQYASDSFVEGYKSSDGTKLYCQPHLDRAEVEASSLL